MATVLLYRLSYEVYMKAYKKHITYAITGLEDLYGVYIKKYSVAGLFDPGRPATVTRAKRV